MKDEAVFVALIACAVVLVSWCVLFVGLFRSFACTPVCLGIFAAIMGYVGQLMRLWHKYCSNVCVAVVAIIESAQIAVGLFEWQDAVRRHFWSIQIRCPYPSTMSFCVLFGVHVGLVRSFQGLQLTGHVPLIKSPLVFHRDACLRTLSTLQPL